MGGISGLGPTFRALLRGVGDNAGILFVLWALCSKIYFHLAVALEIYLGKLRSSNLNLYLLKTVPKFAKMSNFPSLQPAMTVQVIQHFISSFVRYSEWNFTH